MDQKVHFMHARCNCLNTKVFGQMLGHKIKKNTERIRKVFGQMLGHKIKKNTERIRVPLFMGCFKT